MAKLNSSDYVALPLKETRAMKVKSLYQLAQTVHSNFPDHAIFDAGWDAFTEKRNPTGKPDVCYIFSGRSYADDEEHDLLHGLISLAMQPWSSKGDLLAYVVQWLLKRTVCPKERSSRLWKMDLTVLGGYVSDFTKKGLARSHESLPE